MPDVNVSEYYSKPQGRTRWASFENPRAEKGAAAQENYGAKGHPFDKIPAGGTVNLLDYSEGAGMITRIWLTLNHRSPYILRSLVLRCYWDGAEKPAVEVPLGDFFSCGSQLCKFENELFSSPEGRSFNSYVPMPFSKSAKITITNDSEYHISHLYYDVDMIALDEPKKDALYFHCYWNRMKETVLTEEYEMLPRINGCGRILGASLIVNANPVYGNQWWGEGEVKAYIDGDSDFPTLCGTGTEDYIGTAWEQGTYANRYQGCLMADKEARRWVFYRIHAVDPVWFEKDIKFTIQVMGGTSVEDFKKLKSMGAPHIAAYSDNGKGLKHLYKTDEEIYDEGGVCYFRSDDFASAVWFYLDAKENSLPPLASHSVRTHGLR